MEEQAPPIHIEVGSSSEINNNNNNNNNNSSVDVTLKRKTVHTNVTVVESATRFWLSAQVMVACILLGLLATSIQSSRHSITYFPATFNSSCTDSTYNVKTSIEGALIVMLDDAVNLTNTQYQNSVNLTRGIISKSMNMSMVIFMQLLKNVNPLLYCTLDSGLAMVQSTKLALRGIQSSIPNISCPIPIPVKRNTRDLDVCKDATDALQSVAGRLTNTLGAWPAIPPSLTDALNDALGALKVDKYINDLQNFPAPDFILTVNSADIIQKALANASAFDDIAVTCTEVSVKFNDATRHTAKVMYYIEIVIWVSIVVLLVGIFVVAIIRQFPTVVVDWITGKIEYYTNRWDTKIDGLEKNAVRTWQLYLIWTLKYINFKKAILTTAYGIIGIILVYNLTSITNAASTPVEVWVNNSLGPGFDKIQMKLQDGINQVVGDVERQLNIILQDQILSAIVPANGTLSNILTEKNHVIDTFKNMSAKVYDVPVIGPAISNGIDCMLPLGALGIVDTAINLMVTFMQEIISAQLTFPRLTFPNMSQVAVSATHIVIKRSVQEIQDELQVYFVIFIILSIAFGILVLQGLLFVGLRRVAMRIKKQRRLTRFKSQQQQ